MEDNPYQAFMGLLEGPAPSDGLVLGQVTSAAPLKVLVGGNTMESGELLCSADLAATKAKVGGKLIGGGSVGDASGSASLTLEGELERRDPLWTVGEKLLLLPIEEAQRYIIICKVVDL